MKPRYGMPFDNSLSDLYLLIVIVMLYLSLLSFTCHCYNILYYKMFDCTFTGNMHIAYVMFKNKI